jgi:uncharacterized membrane protein
MLVLCIVLSVMVGIRAAVHLQYPKPLLRQTDDVHWRFAGLYVNRHDPALFVPRRGGPGWTVNFGRPQVIVFLGFVLFIGVCAPIVIFKVLLGE